MVLALVPALEEHPRGAVALVAGGLDEAQDLGVVGGGELEVGDPDLDVLQPDHPVGGGGHVVPLSDPKQVLRHVCIRRNRWLMTFS